MPVVVPVKFTYASRDLWFDPEGLDIVQGDYAVCCTERGTEIGLVTSDPFDVSVSELGSPLKSVIRIADDADLDRADELATRGDDAMYEFRRLVERNKLDMKPVGVEFLFGGEKAVFYFAAEGRVDFRQLVRDLSSYFHVRVDMRQIGVRDETRLVGGYATCGQELCCARFGGQFEPVSIRMAKEQDLPLNSSKISGVCGRLMCCLRYEFEAYKDFKMRAPKKKTLIETPLGKARILEYNTPREQLVLRLESGKVFRVALSDMTCTDENVKRCEQQGCNARPDCVSRDVLERLESPELQLALLELDRQNGVDVGDGLSTADRIVASGPTPRRKRMREEEAARTGEGGKKAPAGQGQGGQGSATGRKGRGKAAAQPAKQAQGQARSAAAPQDDDASNANRRRRRRASAAAEQAENRQPRRQTEQDRQDNRQDQQAPSRRRRHRASDGAQGASPASAPSAREERRAPQQEADVAPGRGRRRRHTVAGTEGQAQAPREAGDRPRSHKPDVPSVADQVADGKVRVSRRRPGDGGGMSASEGQRAANGPDASADDAGQGQKRRRRHRSRKPRQDGADGGKGPRNDGPGGSSGSSAPSAE